MECQCELQALLNLPCLSERASKNPNLAVGYLVGDAGHFDVSRLDLQVHVSKNTQDSCQAELLVSKGGQK